MAWVPFAGSTTLGTEGSEGGVIVRDELCDESPGSRITLEGMPRGTHAITCGIYGWMVHTRYAGHAAEANADFDAMKRALQELLALVPRSDDPALEQKARALAHRLHDFALSQFP